MFREGKLDVFYVDSWVGSETNFRIDLNPETMLNDQKISMIGLNAKLKFAAVVNAEVKCKNRI